VFQVFLNCGASREVLFPEVLLRRGWEGCGMFYGGAIFGGERNFAVVTDRDVSNMEGEGADWKLTGSRGTPFTVDADLGKHDRGALGSFGCCDVGLVNPNDIEIVFGMTFFYHLRGQRQEQSDRMCEGGIVPTGLSEIHEAKRRRHACASRSGGVW
jgi:hypothetical protein